MDKPLPDITIALDSGVLSVGGVPDCFMTPLHAQAHFDSWANVPIDVNLEADAFAAADDEYYSECVPIRYDCLAWQ